MIYDRTSPDYINPWISVNSTRKRGRESFLKGTGVIFQRDKTGLYSLGRMAPVVLPQTQPKQRDPGGFVRAGGWLFRHRTITPVPLALAVLLVPEGREQGSVGSVALIGAGAILVALGEAVRLWGVRQIGAVSRTRSDRLGPLVTSGPFAFVRNPLYLGNVALWAGFAVSARLPWLAPLFVAILAFEYHAIVRWEEQLLEQRLGERYHAYTSQVPRWIPTTRHGGARRDLDASATPVFSTGAAFSWRETFYSERGTLIAIAVGYALLILKHNL
jgi:protein-S-isoprenylcysteine O-methyltransferase Ste14